jgi:hypothetical protein
MIMQKDFRERVEYFNSTYNAIEVTVSLDVTFDSDAAVYAVVNGHKSRKAMRVRIGDNLNISFVVPASTRYAFYVEYGGLRVRGARVQRRTALTSQDDHIFQPTYPAIDETPDAYPLAQPQPTVEPDFFIPQGGTFGGAGASGSWDAPEPARESYTSSYSSRDDSSSSSSSSSNDSSSSSSSSDSGGGGGGD